MWPNAPPLVVNAVVFESLPTRVKTLFTVVVPVTAPMLSVVAALAKFTVVAVVLIRSNDVLLVVILVVIAGDVSNTNAPEPTSPVTAAARFAEDGVAKNVATPVPSPLTPVEIGSPVAFVSVRALGVPRLGVTSVGEVAKTSEPDPVSSEITPAT